MAESSDSLTSETLDFLADAKKGKPRRFVMITKGVSIVSLIVYKKGSLEKHKKTAKENGRGIVCFGVVEGSGQNLSFKLCAADGFQEGPVKATILKGFLADSGFPCKPTFEIVESLPDVPEEDGPLSSPPQSADSSIAESTAPPASSKDASDADPRFAQLLAAINKLMPSVKLAISKQPSERDMFISSLSQAKEYLRNGEFDQAREIVLSVGMRVKELLQTAPSSGAQADSAEQWQQLCQTVIQELKVLAKVIAGTKDPDAAAAIVELKAVIANLSTNPSGAGIQDLQRYLNQDDVVADVCNFAFDFRTPLLDCLKRMTTNG